MIALDISKTINKVYRRSMLHKQAISRRNLSNTKSFLSGTSVKDVVNVQSSEADEINAGIPKGIHFSPTLFLLSVQERSRINMGR